MYRALEAELIQAEARLRELMMQAVQLAVMNWVSWLAVTGDVHYLNPEDAIYRRFWLAHKVGLILWTVIHCPGYALPNDTGVVGWLCFDGARGAS